MKIPFCAQQIDHVELFVPDRYEAARWYEQVLGLKIVREFEHWAGPAGGPLMISSDGGSTMLALFTGPPQGNREAVGIRRVAFRVSGEGFLQFLQRLPELSLTNGTGQTVTPEATVDHGRAFSIYFTDPSGNMLEITTYDFDLVADSMKK